MAEDREDRLVFIEGKDETYNLQDLMTSEAVLIGKGSLGNTYKAFLKVVEVVAVKRLKAEFGQEMGKEKLQKLGEISHENLLPFKAFMLSNHEQLLVYEYMTMGSLHSLLHGVREGGRRSRKGKAKIGLAWETRVKIAYGVARGIEFIHTRGPHACHGNIRSSNVFLTHSCDARLSEFGIAQLFVGDGKVNMLSGYRASEVKCSNDICQQDDVYGFGVLLLELVTGKDLVEARLKDEGFSLAKWVRLMFREKAIIDVFDQGIRKYKKEAIGERMVQMLELAICCTFENPNKRPLIPAVVKRIEEIRGV